MLNFKEKDLRAAVETPQSIGDTRQALTDLYHQRLNYLSGKAQWTTNDQALFELNCSYSRLLLDRIWEAYTDNDTIKDSELLDHTWLQVRGSTSNWVSLDVNYATEDHNTTLFSIQQPLTERAVLAAHNLPTLTKKGDEFMLPESDYEPLIQMIKLLYKADYRFTSARETILQPVNNLTFPVVFNQPKNFTATEQVGTNVNKLIHLDTQIGRYDVRSFKVVDEDGNNVTKEGKPQISASGLFTWKAENIAPLLDHELTLTVVGVETESLPSLDKLFISAANNSILMKTGDTMSSYRLELPNKKTLGVSVDARSESLVLHYPDDETQVYELIKQYPFLGEWLNDVIIKK
ncbi:hypothetical protein IV38_GL001835 [Lactobacillus selangorensis]|uniref:Uncharacterized protein n=1 Tax=Lactobacillus selangorensis TaxID=81857 RepID=A0A0R2FS92_9LACO|nr:hypothetical protein [Lactobacillus selangorensis]KRN27994.1 hypothetical protein IV38_GL001835 [Lactobacillus selangorensis]KRN30535.1 hypothetical protein IV40_GL001720 [Lactobacillus selangorensis]